MAAFRVSLDMEAVEVWIEDEVHGDFKIAHVFRPDINKFLLEKEGDRYESAVRNSFQVALNNAVRDSIEKLERMGRFRDRGVEPNVVYRPLMEAS